MRDDFQSETFTVYRYSLRMSLKNVYDCCFFLDIADRNMTKTIGIHDKGGSLVTHDDNNDDDEDKETGDIGTDNPPVYENDEYYDNYEYYDDDYSLDDDDYSDTYYDNDYTEDDNSGSNIFNLRKEFSL